MAALISNSVLANQALRIGGVCYLFWLAWDGWKPETETSPSTAGSNEHVKFFKRGLIVNLLNPKAAIFYIAILPTFIKASSYVMVQAVTLTVLYVLIATIIHSLIVILAATARQFLEDDRKRLIVRRILSVALASRLLYLLARC